MAKKDKKEKKEVKNSKDKTSFMKSFKVELKKVNWPTPKQLFNNTVAVLTIVIITAVIVFVLDFAFKSMNKYGIDKIKEVVSNSDTTETIDENTVTIEESTDESNETSDESTEVNSENTDISNEETETEENTENKE